MYVLYDGVFIYLPKWDMALLRRYGYGMVNLLLFIKMILLMHNNKKQVVPTLGVLLIYFWILLLFLFGDIFFIFAVHSGCTG